MELNPADSRISVTLDTTSNSSVLTVTGLQRNESGNYVCQFTNVVSSSVASIQVTVQGTNPLVSSLSAVTMPCAKVLSHSTSYTQHKQKNNKSANRVVCQGAIRSDRGCVWVASLPVPPSSLTPSASLPVSPSSLTPSASLQPHSQCLPPASLPVSPSSFLSLAVSKGGVSDTRLEGETGNEASV